MSIATTPLQAIPPWVLEPATRRQWLTVSQCARLWNKHRNTIREWCETGYFAYLGVGTYRDPRGYWFIRVT